jgi:hypothetical protein
MKMRAAQYSGIGRIEFQELEKPVIKRDELLIKVPDILKFRMVKNEFSVMK